MKQLRNIYTGFSLNMLIEERNRFSKLKKQIGLNTDQAKILKVIINLINNLNYETI